MDARALETLLWIVRLGGVTAAGRHMNLTQPAITRRIRALEQELGTQLFRRVGRGLTLTEPGRACVAVAERLVADLAALRLAAGGAAAIAGPLRLGVSEAIALTWIDRLLARIAQAYPRMVPELHVDLSAPLLRKLAAREVDIALTPGAITLRGATVVDLGQCALRWVAHPAMLPPGSPATPADLAEQPIIAPTADADLHAVMLAWFRLGGAMPQRVSHCNSFSVLVSLVRKGVGLSLLPEELMSRFIDSGELVALAEHPRVPRVAYSAAYLPRDDLPVLGDVARFAREAASDPLAWRGASGLDWAPRRGG
jgi:DNA-binding transcriptional LysR family regulator